MAQSEDNRKPRRGIFCERSLNSFKESESCSQIFEFVRAGAAAVAGKKISDVEVPSGFVT